MYNRILRYLEYVSTAVFYFNLLFYLQNIGRTKSSLIQGVIANFMIGLPYGIAYSLKSLV